MRAKAERRMAERKPVEGIHFSHLTSYEKLALIAREGVLVDASSRGFLLHVDRKNLVPSSLRQNLTISVIEGEHILLRISEMDLDIDGIITRTRLVGKGVFEIGVEFTADAPEYWRQCFVDLLPDQGEFDDVD